MTRREQPARTTAALRTYARRGHRKVQGWLEPAAIDVILNIVQMQYSMGLRGAVCEIGVHHGRLFILLCLATRSDELAVAYDLFAKQEENVDNSGRGDLENFLLNLAKHHCQGNRIKTIQANSITLDSEMVISHCELRPRLFSIDGGHTAEITAHDLHTAAGSICRGGVIILDDFFNQAWPGVAEGTVGYMLAQPRGLVPFAIAGNKVFLTNDVDRAKEYKSELAQLQRKYFTKTTDLFGHKVIVLWTEPVPLKSRLQTALVRTRQRIPAPLRRGIRRLIGR